MCATFEELVAEAKEIVDGDVRLTYIEGEHEITVERKKDFDVMTEFTVLNCEKMQ